MIFLIHRRSRVLHTGTLPNHAATLIPGDWFAESHANLDNIHAQRDGNALHWQDDGRIGREGYSYEFIPCEDHSPSAQALRGTFDSWFTRCSRTPWKGAS